MQLNRKNKFLIIGFLAAIFISYKFAVSNTLYYHSQYVAKKEMLTTDVNSPQLALVLRKREMQLDTLLSRYKITNEESYQNNLLKKLNNYSVAYNFKIIDFKSPHVITANGFITSSYVFSLKGTFNGCLKAINNIENNPGLGIVKHLNFAKKRNYKTNADELFVEVVLQKIRQVRGSAYSIKTK